MSDPINHKRSLEQRRRELLSKRPGKYCSQCTALTYPDDPSCLECGQERPELGWPELRDSMDPWLGRVLEGRYLLTRRIGQGASASVYRAESLAISRQFAIKIIHPSKGSNGPTPEQIATRLEREVEALGRLRNPHIVRFYDVIELPLNHIGVVMDFVAGETLEALVLGRTLSISRACSLLRQIANGVYEAHLAGMTHRDLKPENVMVEQLPAGDDFVHVLDFGIVQVEGEAGMTQGFIGTPLYASPEQAMGEVIDHRSDIYSLGAIFFFMLSGRPPFLGQNVMQVLRQHVELVPPRISELRSDMGVPEALESLVARMLAKEASNRPDSLNEVIQQLDRLSYSTSEGRETVGAASSEGHQDVFMRAQDIPAPTPASSTSPGAPLRQTSTASHAELSEAASLSDSAHFQTEPSSPPPLVPQLPSSQPAEFQRSTPQSGIFGRVRRPTPAAQQAQGFERKESKSGSLLVSAAQSVPAEQVRVAVPEGAKLKIVASTSHFEFAFMHAKILHVWNLASGEHHVATMHGESEVTALAIASELVLIGRGSGEIEVLELSTGQITTLFESVFADVVADLAVTRDGKLMLALMESGRLYMSAASKPPNEWVRVRGGARATHVTLSPRGDLMALARASGAVEVARVAEPKQIRLNIDVVGDVDSMAFSDDGYLLGVSGGADDVTLYQVLNGKSLVEVAVEDRKLLAFFFSQRNSLVGYVLEDQEIFIVELQA